ncbi:4-hydroxy-tetrahydrodipicolinate synthase [Murinocardiopsis flavida]|uniref:4-hydroxy-tetrahydrodipicolinate synthase n=1 Tax=Murinocardiopsis flavida TaxID=645275 RepID=A0A2P8D6V3_9ACTN|nr:dihydrodipicolinate synthase family protein [Murinocardiopsis flavida]PSK92938.1 4-hydroxy-tetrahydrodipicolinate synthase [Murinocardiopsis flavida]
MEPINGLHPILATPFHPDGGLDIEGLRRLVRFQRASGAAGVAVFGMASEGFALTAAERARILDTVRSEAGDRFTITAGVNGTGTEVAIEQARQAADHGADGLMVLPPFLVKPGPAQVVEFYRQVAGATGLDVMIQDAPGVTGVAIPPGAIAEIAAFDRVTSVKVEAQPTAPKVAAVVRALAESGRDLAVLGGQNAFFMLEEYAAGAVGTMPACEFTDLLDEVLVLVGKGDTTGAHRSFTRLLPLIRFGMQAGLAWAVHKEVLVRRGVIASAAVRLPAADLDEGTRAGLDAVLDALPMDDYATVLARSAGGA